MTYKIERLAKILTVVAGIIVVSVSLGMIAALELVSHHKDPATAKTFSEVLTLILLVSGIGGFLTPSGELKAMPVADCPKASAPKSPKGVAPPSLIG